MQYLTTVLTIDWFGVGLGSRQVKKSLNDRPEGTSLPPIGIPVDVDFNRQRLAVYFRPLPSKLWIGSVALDDDEDAGGGSTHRLVGGRWPTDGHPWKLSNDDAMLYADSGELQLFMEPDSVSGDGPAISVATAAEGRRVPAGGERGRRQAAAPSAGLWSRQRNGWKVRPDVARTRSAALMSKATAGQRRAHPIRSL